MPSNQTSNYGLSQWSKSDRIQMEDFNADNAKIDAALAAQASTLSAHAAQLAKLGNCQVWTTTYKGTGTVGPDHPTSLTFPKRPVFAMIDSGSGKPSFLLPQSGILYNAGSNDRNNLTWNGATASWYLVTTGTPFAAYQLNARDVVYYVTALLAAD